MTRVLNMKTKEFEGKHDSPVMDAILDSVLRASVHDKTSPPPTARGSEMDNRRICYKCGVPYDEYEGDECLCHDDDSPASPVPAQEAPAPKWSTDKDAEIYPCADCGAMRSINQGAHIFAVCDECWEKVYGAPKPTPPPSDVRERRGR